MPNQKKYMHSKPNDWALAWIKNCYIFYGLKINYLMPLKLQSIFTCNIQLIVLENKIDKKIL